MIQISPALTLATQYSSLIQWDGDLVVRTVHGGKKYLVPASEIVDLTEVGVLISWRGVDPTGVFLPWSEVVSIEQAA